ncbi:hypothetical protein Q5752_005606 [Cryptotrichosporon argae]
MPTPGPSSSGSLRRQLTGLALETLDRFLTDEVDDDSDGQVSVGTVGGLAENGVPSRTARSERSRRYSRCWLRQRYYVRSTISDQDMQTAFQSIVNGIEASGHGGGSPYGLEPDDDEPCRAYKLVYFRNREWGKKDTRTLDRLTHECEYGLRTRNFTETAKITLCRSCVEELEKIERQTDVESLFTAK